MFMQRHLLVVVSLSAYLAVSGPGADFSGRGQKNTVGSQDASLTDQELNTLNDLAPKILYLDKLSEAAAQKASDPKTKDLANKVVQDYNNIRSQFRKVATNHSFSYRDAIDL